MSTVQWPSRIVPARLSFLAIYNPTLGGESDESFREQLVFYYSRTTHEARVATRKSARNEDAGGHGLRAEENEKLRQIGLAQGMVDFARNFSGGEPVDSIETEKSRIVLHELERGWWILASIDLTRLPAIFQSSSKPGTAPNKVNEPEATVEYSSREISPPALLIQDLLQAHYIFSLHHGPCLDDLFVRLTKDKFCNILDRFWARFARNWDVLLHGNPAVDIFSGIKLASGGELGFGVGEEEWGSGEREVLEDLVRRTDGIVDLVVTRFGETASDEEEKQATQQDNLLPWIGRGTQPTASDGLIFGGIGAIQRRSLRSLSLWMRHIYTYGEQAYGVKDNPLRERRKRRRRTDVAAAQAVDGPRGNAEAAVKQDRRTGQSRSGNQLGDKGQSGNTKAFDPDDSIDAQDTPIESASINQAADASSAACIQTKIPPPIVATTAQPEREESNHADESTNVLGIPDTYMKYLTLGLSTLGKQKQPSGSPRGLNSRATLSASHNKGIEPQKLTDNRNEQDASSILPQVDSVPDEELIKAKLALQRRRENRGHFIIGLKGDLMELDELSEDEQDEVSDDSVGDDTDGSRIVLRTLLIETIPPAPGSGNDTDNEELESFQMAPTPVQEGFRHFRRVRVLLYVHRPFMYCFLFETRVSSLQYTRFYRLLHRNLVPIHKPLLSSTSPTKVAHRIDSARKALSEEIDSASIESSSTKTAATNKSPIYELIHDPRRMTLHTSIPNVPEPGTPAAEGIFASSVATTEASPAWTRVEALNVHSQILSTLASVKNKPGELERTSKTSRGWWIVWMKVPPSPHSASPSNQTARSESETGYISNNDAYAENNGDEDMHRTAFLVRKASDAPMAPKALSTGSRAMNSMLEVMSLGLTSREDEGTSGPGTGWGPAALAGGIGIDARAYVQNLLSLNR